MISLILHRPEYVEKLLRFYRKNIATAIFSGGSAVSASHKFALTNSNLLADMLAKIQLSHKSRTRLLCAPVTPTNLVPLLTAHVRPIAQGLRHFDVIKIDIDSFDADILGALLKNFFTAKHFILEVNPGVPPPHRFAARYHPALVPVMGANAAADSGDVYGGVGVGGPSASRT